MPTQLNLAAAGSVCKIWAFHPVHKEKGSARSIYSEDLWSWLNRRPLEGSALLVVRADRSRLERREALVSLRRNPAMVSPPQRISIPVTFLWQNSALCR